VEVYNGVTWKAIANWTNQKGDDDTWHYETLDITPYLANNFSLRFISKEKLKC